MSLPDILFLTAVCAAFGVFMVVLATGAWICRDTLVESHPRPAKAHVRKPAAPR